MKFNTHSSLFFYLIIRIQYNNPTQIFSYSFIHSTSKASGKNIQIIRTMLLSRLLFCLVIMVLLLSYSCEAQQEIRKAMRAKTDRKIKEGKRKIQRGQQAVETVKNQARQPFDRAGAKINRKYENTRRKVHQIENVIKS